MVLDLMGRKLVCLFGRGDLTSFFLVWCPPHVVAEWHNQFGYYRRYASPTGDVFEWWDLPTDCYDLWADCFQLESVTLVRV